MKASEIYKISLSLMIEKPNTKIYDQQIVDVINKTLAELYSANNMCRMFRNKLPFIDGIEKHKISKLEDEVDYEDVYQENVIPYGVGAKLFLDDDLSKKTIDDAEYNNAKVENQCMVSRAKVERLKKEAMNAS